MSLMEAIFWASLTAITGTFADRTIFSVFDPMANSLKPLDP